MPRSWVSSPTYRIMRRAVEILVDVSMGTWGEVGGVLRGRRVVFRERDVKRWERRERVQA